MGPTSGRKAPLTVEHRGSGRWWVGAKAGRSSPVPELRDGRGGRKVAGSRPDEVNDVINLPNPSGRTRPWSLFGL
jgi:hypothetical protein